MAKNTKSAKRVRILKSDGRRRLVTPQANLVIDHMSKSGHITLREALMDHSIQSLTRRITELRDAGFGVVSEQRTHPITGQKYTRYSLAA